ncbi:MAG TPA: discoidin domain-containing protein, partial [Trueperaceae bacterium]|nr:discoidin domain-containing protein [Trueperaceae bacterium]
LDSGDLQEAIVAAEPEAAPLVAGPPPPPGILELEPNDDASRAMRLVPGQVHVGRLTAGSDDYYRFFVARDQYVRLELQPPEGGLPIDIYLDGVGWLSVLEGDAGGPAVYDRKFLAGNQGFFLRSPKVESDGYYQLRMTFLNNLMLPVDAEPNDDMLTASILPAELEWTGQAGEFKGDPDFYRLPVFDHDTSFQLTLEGTSKRPDVMFTSEDGRLQLGDSKSDVDGGVWSGTIPAGESTWLRLYVGSRYVARLSFDGVPDPAQLLAPRTSGALNVTLESSTDELAAFWHEGQAFVATANVENRTDSPQEVRLEAISNDPLVQLSYEAGLTLAAGESRSVPVEVLVPRDLRDDLPLMVEVSATSADGSAAADVVAAARCEAQPVDPRAAWPLPDSLLGRFDALRPNLGAGIFGETDHERRDGQLIDGRVGPSGGGFLSLQHTPTYQLAGDGPVTLLGATLDPRSDGRVGDVLKAFRIETSLDGQQFTPAFDGVLEASSVEQVFVFDAPVKARYARLVFLSSQGNSSNAYLGEWKLIAAQDATFGEVNLAAPEVGGHVVTSDPYIGNHGAALITADDGRTGAVDLREKEAFTFVVGFHDGRAGQVTRLEWQEPLAGSSGSGDSFPGATVEVSLTGGAGPWAPLADWTLQRDAGGLATLQFEEPVWARYLKFTAAKVAGDDGNLGRYYFPPDVLRVFERAPDDEYRSALGEWGPMARDGDYEYLNPVTMRATTHCSRQRRSRAESRSAAPWK